MIEVIYFVFHMVILGEKWKIFASIMYFLKYIFKNNKYVIYYAIKYYNEDINIEDKEYSLQNSIRIFIVLRKLQQNS